MLSALQVDLTAVLVPCAVQLAGACARRPHRQHTCSRLCQTIIPCCLRLQALEARGLIGSVQEMIQGAPTGPQAHDDLPAVPEALPASRGGPDRG